jgi:hypothetical protein
MLLGSSIEMVVGHVILIGGLAVQTILLNVIRSTHQIRRPENRQGPKNREARGAYLNRARSVTRSSIIGSFDPASADCH